MNAFSGECVILPFTPLPFLWVSSVFFYSWIIYVLSNTRLHTLYRDEFQLYSTVQWALYSYICNIKLHYDKNSVALVLTRAIIWYEYKLFWMLVYMVEWELRLSAACCHLLWSWSQKCQLTLWPAAVGREGLFISYIFHFYGRDYYLKENSLLGLLWWLVNLWREARTLLLFLQGLLKIFLRNTENNCVTLDFCKWYSIVLLWNIPFSPSFYVSGTLWYVSDYIFGCQLHAHI